MKKNIKKIDNKKFNDSLKKIWSPGKFDPNGSYTGITYDYANGYENEKISTPVQDADDLWVLLQKKERRLPLFLIFMILF